MANSGSRRKLIEHEMREQAAELFAKRGFSNTTLREVAEVMGISRAAIYHYIESKEELLIELVKGLAQETADNLEAIHRADGSPSDKLYQAISTTAATVASNAARWRLLELSEGSLPPDLATEHRANRDRALKAMTELMHEAVNTGAARPVDEEVAAFGIMGACNWVAWWRSSRPDLRSGELGAILAKAITTGLLYAGEAPRTTDDAITAIRENLEFLQRQIKG
ncbi:MAG TPA: TetR/AcrR family transcriptional regulator [Mycobacterium sp.]|jgi:AcrR family transcriptional regulator|nr:TetR/AcrR family transcriptional regulator [Mycobacterium sp.]